MNVPLAAGLPHRPYADVATRVAALRPADEVARAEFAAAWEGIAHRFRACVEEDEAFRTLWREGAPGFTKDQYYRAEKALFGFFSNGLAALESCAYGIFAVGALIRPESFPLERVLDRRNATLGATLRTFNEEFREEELTRLLFWRLNSREFGWWREVRGLLAQRLSRPPQLGRGEASSEPSADQKRDLMAAEWSLRGFPVDERLTALKRQWLTEVLAELLAETARFMDRRLPRA